MGGCEGPPTWPVARSGWSMCERTTFPMLAHMEVIEVTKVTKRYGDRVVVDDVSFAVEEGEIFAILGPNGAGKTTIAESIAGLRRPDSGRISVLGLDPDADREAVRR